MLRDGSDGLHTPEIVPVAEVSCLLFEIPILGYLGVLSYFWGYLATSGAKSDAIFLFCDTDFL